MLRIDYTLNASDAIAFKQAAIARIEVPYSVQRERKANYLLTLAFTALALTSLLLLQLQVGPLPALFFGLVAGIYATRTPLAWRYRRWRARQAVAREAPQDLLPMGQLNRSLLISERHLIYSAEGIESRIPWSRIDPITIADHRAFLFVNNELYSVIPRYGVTSGEFDAFVVEASSRIIDAAQQLADADPAGGQESSGAWPAGMRENGR